MRVEEKDHPVLRFDTGRKWSVTPYPTSQWASSDRNHILLYTHTLEEPVHTFYPCFLGNLFRGSGYTAAFWFFCFSEVRVWHALFPWGWIVSKHFVKSSKGPTCKTCADSRSCVGWSNKSSELHRGNVPLCFNRNLLSPGNEAVWMLLAVNNIYTASFSG